MIQLKNISKSFGTQILFENVNQIIGSKERVGLVGRNGSGKSTLFKMILGEILTDSGDIAIPKNYKLGHLEQHIHFTKPTVLEECMQVIEELHASDELELDSLQFEAEKILFGLGFKKEDMEKDPKSFSGGYQIRINLTKALLQKPNMLLLDEPTNYLDIVSIRWLKNFLKIYPGELLIITHDRDFMDEVVTHVMGIHRKQIKKVKGDTVKFYEQILQEEEIYEKTRENLEKKKKDLQQFIDRFKAKASKAAQAQSRMKLLEKMGDMKELDQEANLGFRFRYKEFHAKNLAQVEHVSFGYEGFENLFSHLSFAIGSNDRIGIIGKNGKGKSTLLNIISGDLTPREGKMSYHPSTLIGHFGQTNINRLGTENDIVQEIQSANGELAQSEVRNICGAMMFDGDLAKKKIKVLSGGERARVMLGKILATPNNLLLLDEPTNHLDMESIESLTEEIARFPGAVVMVTHSEIMLKNLVNKLVVFHNGTAEFFEGTYDDFLEKIGWESEESHVVVDHSKKLSDKERRQKRQEIIQERARVLRPIEELIKKIEEEIEKNEMLLARIQGELNRPEVLADNAKLQNYTHAVGKLNNLIDESFEKLSLENEQLLFLQNKYEHELKELE